MRAFILFISILCATTLFAQNVGDFDTTLTISSSPFNGSSRLFSLSVPTNYDSSNDYPLIVGLHGFYQDATVLRSILSNYASTNDYIVICPDGDGDMFDDEYSGLETDIISLALDFVNSNYSIDNTKEYLFGYSAGARTALYYGLDHYYSFDGILSFAPAFQNTSDVNNNFPYPWANPFNYENGQLIPTCICTGTLDNYFNRSVLAVEALQDSLATVLFQPVNSVDHTLNYSAFEGKLSSCLNFFNSQLNVENSNEITNQLIYPIPVKRELFIQKGCESYKIYNIKGKEILSDNYQNSIDVSTLPSGFYLLQGAKNGVYFTQKFIKINY